MGHVSTHIQVSLVYRYQYDRDFTFHISPPGRLPHRVRRGHRRRKVTQIYCHVDATASLTRVSTPVLLVNGTPRSYRSKEQHDRNSLSLTEAVYPDDIGLTIQVCYLQWRRISLDDTDAHYAALLVATTGPRRLDGNLGHGHQQIHSLLRHQYFTTHNEPPR
jgi:hypothetical protein